MTVQEVESFGYMNIILHDPYQYTHPFGPSLYQAGSNSGEWYFYFSGREIFVDKEKLTQLLKILEP